MAAPTIFANDVVFNGAASFSQSPSFPSGAITNSQVSASAAIGAEKVVHEHAQGYELFAEGASITTIASKLLHATRGASGAVVGIDAFITTAPTSANCTVTIDLQKSSAATTTFTTILSAPLVLGSTSITHTRYSPTVSASTKTTGDLFRATITTAGTTAGAGKGLHLTFFFTESYA